LQIFAGIRNGLDRLLTAEPRLLGMDWSFLMFHADSLPQESTLVQQVETPGCLVQATGRRELDTKRKKPGREEIHEAGPSQVMQQEWYPILPDKG